MPIARVMNMPDGSTPVPAPGGGDSNGTLAASILWQHAGTAAQQIAVPAHIVAQTTTAGIPDASVAQQVVPVAGASEEGLDG